jgi:hypothetical protein
MISVAATAHDDETCDDARLAPAARCWSWYACAFGCQYVDDCALLTPLPVHDTEQERYRMGTAA